jgi:multiphosphoryl transfer protein
MIGLILVSHSRPLALALKEMLERFYDNSLHIAVAAGAGDDGKDLGTDATAIVAAIEEVCGDNDGALILLDLGSAVLSAELALDLLDESLRARVALCSAPLVEGAIAAGAQIKIGASLDAARAEAENALLQKTKHLANELGAESAPSSVSSEETPDVQTDLQIETEHGLHARPAMRIVQTVGRFASAVHIRNLRTHGSPASARSLVAVNCLDARKGDIIRITAVGSDASEAIAALEALHAENFGDPREVAAQTDLSPKSSSQPSTESDQIVRGEPLSGGVAVGPLCFAVREALKLPEATQPVDAKLETARLRNALASVRQQLDENIVSMSKQFGSENAGILEAHRLLADDPFLGERAVGLIADEHLSASHAWYRASEEVAAGYRSLEDPTLRERVRDIEDFSLQVFAELGFSTPLNIDLPAEPCVLAVPSLLPSDIVRLDLKRIHGVIAEFIGQTSHAAILLRSAGVPAVDGIAFAKLRSVKSHAALDGDTGEVWLDPDQEQSERFRLKDQKTITQPTSLLHTQDGRRIELAANVGNIGDAAAAAKAGAEAIGLLRTEFLFLDRSEAPGEDEQTRSIQEILSAFPPGLPVTVRTLDIGGDKPAPYLPVPKEANPFLGVRGVRLTLRRQELFLTHLRAILRGTCDRACRIMFPMVTDPSEMRRARVILSEAHGQLVAGKVSHAWPVEVGMMVEVPAAAINARAFIEDVDFFSIGTNDLTQYTLAVERGHPQLREFADALHPAVLRLISLVATTANRHGKWAGICGEAAADPTAASVFVGLGITELSVGASAVARVRSAIDGATYKECQRLARARLRAT